MKPGAYIGADPGMGGALALFALGRPDFTPGDLDVTILVEDMPALTIDDKRQLDHWKLAAILGAWSSTHDIKDVAIERVHSMPEQGVASSFAFGSCFGAIKQAVASAGLRMTLIPPRSL